jgi:hypothetical protein
LKTDAARDKLSVMTKKPPSFELINVHQVLAEKDIILYLRMGDPGFVESLFYKAKHTGQATFEYRGRIYEINRNKDGSYTAKLSEEQTFNTESFS